MLQLVSFGVHISMPLESVVCLDPFYAGEEVDVGAEDEEYKVHKQVKHAGDGTR